MTSRRQSPVRPQTLRRTLPRPMALEQRFMFDGAGMADVIADNPTSEPSKVLLISGDLAQAPSALVAAQQQVEQAFNQFMRTPQVQQQLFALFRGDQSSASPAWELAARQLVNDVQAGQYGVKVTLLSSQDLRGALGAFTAHGPSGEPVIFLNSDWARHADSQSITRVLLEELGHSVDARLNGETDTTGDEGEAFSAVVTGQTLNSWTADRIAHEDDRSEIVLDGRTYAVEDATVTFTQVYTGTPASLSEEASALNNVSVMSGSNFQFTSVNPGDPYYSGNNVSGHFTYTDGSGSHSIYGVVSRQFKSGGVTQGFYFYASGNDGVIGTGDSGEAAYLFVVNTSHFTAGGNYNTSSDPVDTALNNYLNNYTPASAIADTATALEQGGLSNATAGSNATGNVLSNDAGSATPTVTHAGTTSASTSVSGGGTTIIGTYGTLTMATDGSYTYVVNDNNASVQALRTTSNTLVDSFVYKITDTNAATSTTTLKITIQGANDSPTAANDVADAKVSLTIDGTAYSGTDTIGSEATGNVLNNDGDVDRYSETKTIAGLTASGTYSSYTAGGTTQQLNFTGANGNSIKTVAVGDYVYSPKTGGKYYLLLDSGGTGIQVTGKTANADGSYTFTLSGTPHHTSASGSYTLSNGSTVDFYADASKDNATSLPSGKEAVVGTASSVTYSTVTLTGVTGNVVVGMTATDTGGIIPAGAKVTAVNGSTITLDKQLTAAPTGTISFLATGGTTVNGSYGTLVLNSDGSFTYSPTPDASGNSATTYIDTFTYKMQDAGGLTSTATLTVNVRPSTINDPNATNDAVTGTEQGTSAGTNPAGNVLTGTITSGSGTGGADTSTTSITAARSANAASSTAITGGSYIDLTGNYGTLRIYSSGAYTYTIDNSNAQVDALNAGSSLSDEFYYTAHNASGDDYAKLSVTINGANDAPVVTNDTVSATEDESVTYSASDLLWNDSDVDSSTLTIGAVTSGSGGTVVLNGDGTVTFTPTANFNGNASFTYTASDGTTTTTGTVTVVVAAVNDYPTAKDNSYTAARNTLLSSKNVITDTDSTAGTDSDTESTIGSLTVSRVGTSASSMSAFTANGTDADHLAANGWMQVSLSHGTLYIKADGSTEYEPATNDTTGDSFVYQITDGTNESDVASVNFSVSSTPTVSVNNVTVSEASPYAVFEISLNMPGTGNISFTPVLSNGTATTGTDTGSSAALEYFDGSNWVSAASGITMTAGTTSVLVRTAIVNDTQFEGSESFTLSTGTITGTVTNSGAATGTGTIKDDGSSTNIFLSTNNSSSPSTGSANDDTPTVGISVSPSSKAEDASGVMTYTLTLSNASAYDTTINYSLSGTASSGTDYSASGSGSVTIAAGSTTATITVDPTADGTVEADETVIVTIDSVSTNAVSLSVSGSSAATGTITNDDSGGGDSTPPTIAVSSDKSSLKAGETATITFTLSEASTTFSASDVAITGGTLSGFSGSGTSYTATFTPTASSSGSASVSVASTTFSDAAGNDNTDGGDANNTVSMSFDTQRPTATIVVADTALKAGETSAVTITFNEAVTGLTHTDLTVANGTLSSVSSADGGITWTAIFTPSTNIEDASNLITLDATGITDAAGNGGTGSTDSNNYAIDTLRPTIAVSSDKSSLKAGETATITFTLSESSTTFSASDVAITGGTLSGFSGSGTSYTATFTPTASSSGSASVSVASTTFSDAAGNDNTDGGDANNTVSMSFDTQRPTATIVVADTALKTGETSAVTITFSEAVTGFTNADLTVANGTLSSVSSADGGITWTAIFTPSTNIEDASNLITLDATGITDAAGNAGTGSTDSNNYAIDTLRPTIAVSSDKSSLKAGETATITFTLSESSSNFTASDVSITGGTLSGFSGSGTSYTATFTPTASSSGSASVSVASTTFSDASSNDNADGGDANNTVSMSFDTLRPTATIVVADTALKAGETSAVTITFSEAVTGFTHTDLTVANGTLSSVSSADGGITWTAIFTPSTNIEDASNLITLDATGITDAAGNAGTGSTDSNNYAIDTLRPTIAVSSDKSSLKAGETATITFTLSESSTNFTASDVSITGGTLSGFSGSGTSYTATFTPTASSSGSASVSVTSTTFSDAAGNDNTDGGDANNTVSMSFDTARPQVTASQTYSYAENRLSTDVLATVVASDAGTGVSSFRFANGTTTSNDGYFTIHATTGAISLTASGAQAGAASNDYETGANQFVLSVEVQDQAGNWSTPTDVTLNLTDLNDHTPVAANTTATTVEDTAVSGQLPAATDGDGDPITYSKATNPGHGTVTINPDGSYTYTPTTDFSGTDSFTFNVDDGRGGQTTHTVVVTVAALPRFSVNDIEMDEASGIATFTVTRTGPHGNASTVNYSAGSGSASSGSDFTSTSGTLTFAAGETTKTISIAVIDDDLSEGRETFTVNLSAPTQAKVLDAQGVATIVDDGSLSGGSSDDRPLTVSSPTVTESSPYVIFKVSGQANQAMTLGLQSGSGTVGTDTRGTLQYFDGSAWQDYTPGQTVRVPVNGTPLLVRMALVNDANPEGSESLQLVATNTGGTSFQGQAHICDDGSTGNRFEPDNITGNPDVGPIDDDRPQAAPEPTAPAPAAPKPDISSPIVTVAEPPTITARAFASALAPAVLQADALQAIDRSGGSVGEHLTSVSGFRVSVTDAPVANLIVYRGITDQFVESTRPTQFALPYDAFAHSRSDASIHLRATLSNGDHLPAWVAFDPNAGTFQVMPPKGFKGHLQIKVIARDNEGREVSTMFQMYLGQDRGAQPQSRSGLSDQIKLATSRPSHVGDRFIARAGSTTFRSGV